MKRRARSADAAIWDMRMIAARQAIARAREAVDALSTHPHATSEVDELLCYSGNACAAARIVLDTADAQAKAGRR